MKRCLTSTWCLLASSRSSGLSYLVGAGLTLNNVRCFSAQDRTDSEQGFGHKMKDIPVLTGNPRPVSREPGWTCAYKLSDRMEDVVPELLRKAGWSEESVQREVQQIFLRKSLGATASLNSWSTVEEFQRTPWYRRFRPTDTNAAVFISYEAIKIHEAALIPPSLRGDPYAHLRKRHMEDNWMNDRFSEQTAKYVRKEDLDRHTKGSPTYGTITRKKYLEFDGKFKKEHGGMTQVNETYNAWLNAVK